MSRKTFKLLLAPRVMSDELLRIHAKAQRTYLERVEPMLVRARADALEQARRIHLLITGEVIGRYVLYTE